MRNQRALAAACTTVAVLGLAAPVAVADGMGNGGGPSSSDNTTVIVPGTGNIGTFSGGGVIPGTGNVGGNGHFNGNGNGNFNGNGNGNFNGNFNGNGNGNFNGNGRGGFGNGRGGEGGNNGRGGEGGNNGRGGEGGNNGRGDRGDDFGRGDRGDDFGRGDGRGDGRGGEGDRGEGFGNSRDIFVTPDIVPAGGRVTIIVNGCRSGTASSDAFGVTRLESFRDDTARGVATVDREARRGRYDVTVRCDGRTITRRDAFTVIGGVNGGFGGSRTGGATPTDMAIGGGLVASAVIGGGAFWVRRRHEKRV
ncbi:hypothetical protein [Streptomyces sp. NRRL B-3648]|uniref:hypothetical protein n=1 Tax=Streptomyces sp. NRRL B-3648 TaxID=1519493 RepID=UPI0006AF1822|nr:hypothetical protein [Streptomyces sp. NRRL B-3648]KOX02391.1 integral membrane protein [Streptomyces sp. NRRL B-3648]